MPEGLGPRPPLTPRQPRTLHPGPRTRLLDFVLLFHVAVAFLGLLVAGLMFRDGRPAIAVPLVIGVAALAVIDTRRLIALRRLRHIAQAGHITTGRVVELREKRLSRSARADRAVPRINWPPWRCLEVVYAFAPPGAAEHVGRFVTRTDDASIWPVGRPVEVFYLPAEPAVHVCSLVLRWYWRLGGSPLVDVAPTAEFNEATVEVEWWE